MGGKITGFDLFSSLLSLGVVFLVLSSSTSGLVGEKLITSSITSSSRYGITFPAIDYIESEINNPIIAIGSSIIQAATDGKCISEDGLDSKFEVFNLGISGANPYTEILQIPALIRANPKLVLLDMGPNGLWNFYNSTDLDEYIEFRFVINSIQMNQDDIGGWTEIIREVDRSHLAYTYEEKMELVQRYSMATAEEYLKEIMSEHFELIEYQDRVPPPDSHNWHDYLMKPIFREPFFERKTLHEISENLDPIMSKKVSQGVYNPKSNGTLNHLAYEYMIDELRSANIPVLLVAVPHHPSVNEYLRPGQLDGFNHTFQRFTELSGVYGVNMYWESWHPYMFRDRNHLGEFGREYYCERISEYINQVLSDPQHSPSIWSDDNPNLEHYLEDHCSGKHEGLHYVDGQTILNVENFTDCSLGEGVYYSHKWVERLSPLEPDNTYLSAWPEEHTQVYSINGSRLDYNLTFSESAEYSFMVKMRGNSYSNDTIKIGIKQGDDPYYLLANYSSFGWNSNGDWEWEPESGTDMLRIIALEGAEYTFSIWMKEDGVDIDTIRIEKAMESL